MGLLELFITSVGLGMDSFAVSICKGLSIKKRILKNSLIIGIYFGFFQAIMPIIGYFLGIRFQDYVVNIDHWIAFVLLLFIGGKMSKEALGEKINEQKDDNIDFKTMSILGIATSIDALAVGLTLAFFNNNIWIASIVIGIVAFTLSCIGAKIGNSFGNRYEKTAELIGGLILILMGIKILLEHISNI